MKNPDYLIMCSNCEVRIHPDDYKKHKKICQRNLDYVPYPIYPIYPVYPTWTPPYDWGHWQPLPTPYVYTTTAGTVDIDSPPNGTTTIGITTFTGSNS